MHFMKRISRRTLLAVILGVVVLFAIIGIISATYLHFAKGYVWADWTGFGEYTGPLLKDQRGKTLWDWLGLLVVPLLLGAAALWFNKQEKNRDLRQRNLELEIAKDRQQEEALQAYLDKMTELLLEEKLLELGMEIEIENNPIVKVAQTRTVTALRILDEDRRNILIQFLRDVDLSSFILKEASLNGADLTGADLTGADLTGADLFKANLSMAFLQEAKLSEAELRGADLSGAFLKGVNLSEANLDLAKLGMANLHEANLKGAKLSGADLRGADLSGANLREAVLNAAMLGRANLTGADLYCASLRMANLSWANLRDANLIGANLNSADLTGATMPDGTIHE